MQTKTETNRQDPRKTLADKARETIEKAGLSLPKERRPRIGVAISGGPDSVALLSVGLSMGWEIEALHCNFHLRGAESDRDQSFVEELCGKSGIRLSTIDFDVTSRMTTQRGESVEMACRELRYEWFGRMARELHLDFIALGHHSDDNVETFILNALRGCGLAGVKGIPFRRGIFIRPLLKATRGEILAYLKEKGLVYVTDSTNAETEYGRNRVRNIILPTIESQFPGGTTRLAATAGILADQHRLFLSLLEERRRRYVGPAGELYLAKLIESENKEIAPTLLYHLLDGDLEPDRIDRLISSAGNSGKIYSGKDGREYLLDRGILSILPHGKASGSATERQQLPDFDIESLKSAPMTIATGIDGITYEARIISGSEFHPRRDPSYAWFDAGKISCTRLFTRLAAKGDRIEPFGMGGSTLVSDIFSDNKLSFTDKGRQLVVTDEEKIIWIPGLRNSRHYPVSPASENILELHMLNVAKKS